MQISGSRGEGKPAQPGETAVQEETVTGSEGFWFFVAA